MPFWSLLCNEKMIANKKGGKNPPFYEINIDK
jgi:hypothetical protein